MLKITINIRQYCPLSTVSTGNPSIHTKFTIIILKGHFEIMISLKVHPMKRFFGKGRGFNTDKSTGSSLLSIPVTF